MAKTVTLEVTPGQARAINSALAFCTAGDWEDGGWSHPNQMTAALNAQAKVWAAMAAAKIAP